MKTTPIHSLRARRGAFVAAVLATLLCTAVHAAYDWRTVRIGGGGAVTSLKAHPRVPNLFFMTSDVGNPYRWNHAAQKWEGLLNHVPLSQWNQAACGNLAVDPGDPTGNILYATVGKYAPYVAGYEWINSYGPGKVIKSTDRGTTWNDTGLFIGVSANKDQTFGERLAVDPQNSGVVYVTSHADGTHRSADGGTSWAKINVLNGNFVAIDSTAGLIGGASRNVYIGANDGVYRSTDGGETFVLMAGSPGSARRGVMAGDGTLYVTSYTSGVFKWRAGVWSNVSPATGAFVAVDVNPANSAEVIVSSHAWGATAHYRSRDGGTTWTRLLRSPDFTEVPFSTPDRFALSTFDFCWDPFNANHVWFTDWFNAYQSTNIWADTVVYKARAVDHEEIVTIGMLVCPSSGPNALLSGTADLGGFDHPSISAPPVSSMANFFPWLSPATLAGNMTGAAYQETNPNFIVRVGRRGWDGVGIGGFSTNGGVSYTQWAGVAGMTGGKVAISADSLAIVWVTQSGPTYRSVNRGTTWLPVVSVPNAVIGGTNVFWGGAVNPIAADKVNGSKFYLYHNGAMYVSTDAGASFAVAAIGLPIVSNTAFIKVETSTGIEGDVWVSLGTAGLFHSTNSGASFSRVTNVQDARLMAVGKGLSTVPSVFVLGRVNNIADGIFRSDDGGVSWTQLDTATHEMGDEPNAMAADPNVHGRVFIGTNGNGIFVGDIRAAFPPAAVAGFGATAGDTRIAVSWQPVAGATGYNVKRSLTAGGPYEPIAAAISHTLYVDSGLSNGTPYYYVVSAMNSAGEGPLSTEVSAMPSSVVTQVVLPEADAYVEDGASDTNNGTATTLLVKRDGAPGATWSYLRFPLAGFQGRITSVMLRLYGRHNTGSAVAAVGVHGVPSSPWTETGVTWNTRPAPNAALDSVIVSANERYYEWDVTEFVQSQLAAGATDVSLAAIMTAKPGGGQYNWFNSREAAANPPQLVIAMAGNSFDPVGDAYVQNGHHADTNFGTDDALIVKNDTAPWARQALLKFEVEGVLGEVTAATLRLYGAHYSGSSAPTVSIHGVESNSWTETGVTWNTRPGLGTVLDTRTVSTDQQYYEWDVTSFVQSQWTGGTTVVSLAAVMDALPADDQHNWFNAREAGSQPPQLVLVIAPGTRTPIADAYVQNGSNADTNFGTATTLVVKNDAAPYARQSFLKFAVGTTGARIAHATLRLYGQHNSGASTPSVSIYGVASDAWTEDGLTWNNKPATGPLLDSINTSTVRRYYEWDVTAFVQSQLDAGVSSVSFAAVMGAVPADGQYDWFNSREAGANLPELVITQ